MQERSVGLLVATQKHYGVFGRNIIQSHLNVDVGMFSSSSNGDQTPSHVHHRPSCSVRNQ
jgi:hypothetical protein